MTRSSKASSDVAKLDGGNGALAIVYFMKSRLGGVLANWGGAAMYIG